MPDPYYPTYVLVTLVEIGGTSCQNRHHRLAYQIDSDPPEYRELMGQGDFAYCRLRRIAPSDPTWELTIHALGEICGGLWGFRREERADDPTGPFCRWANNLLDCDNGKAHVADDT